MISARLRRRSERIRKHKKHTIVFHLCSCQGVTAGESRARKRGDEIAARIKLDVSEKMQPGRASSPEGRGESLKGEEDSQRGKRVPWASMMSKRPGNRKRTDLSPSKMQQFPVAMAKGSHLFPYRTQKLSPSAPMVLGWTRPGRVGRRRIPIEAVHCELLLFIPYDSQAR